jgi:hypothetical protein
MLYPKDDCIVSVKEPYIATKLHGVLSQITGSSAVFAARAPNLKNKFVFSLDILFYKVVSITHMMFLPTRS